MTPKHEERAHFEPGAVIAGRYRLVSLIGAGGVGRVFLARHIELDTEVAIKVLRPEMADRPEAVQRFSREARASVRLHSEHIARVLDVGSHGGQPYFVMEYLVGCSLLELRHQPGVDIAMLCEFFIQACEGLAVAHAEGIVHRDIKPENLFVVRDGNGWRRLKLLDFGISKFSLTGKHSDVDLAAMHTEAMMGTPHYISPEQIRATKDVDHRTDIWSFGAVMFEVLSGGILPFREEREMTALIAEVLERPHRSLLDVAPNVPGRLAAIVDRCLIKNRDQRYQTVAEVALELLPLAPIRARASAERAVTAMQAAGLMPINGDIDSLRPSSSTLSNWLSPAPASAPGADPSPSDSEPDLPPPLGDGHAAFRTAATAATAISSATDTEPGLAQRRATERERGGAGAATTSASSRPSTNAASAEVDQAPSRRRRVLFVVAACLGVPIAAVLFASWPREQEKGVLSSVAAATPASAAIAQPAIESTPQVTEAAPVAAAPQASGLSLEPSLAPSASAPSKAIPRPAAAPRRTPPVVVVPTAPPAPKTVDSIAIPKLELRRER